MDATRVDLVIKYALAVAAQNDEFLDRRLGPIHLIKYVYLADLVHAEQEQGETFTGAPWRFYHYGPWSSEVFERVEPAVSGLEARTHRWTNQQFENDVIRYEVRADDELYERLKHQLPMIVALRVRRYVREFGKDTHDLLDYVYRTRPMLRASPGEPLDFSCMWPVERGQVQRPAEEAPLTRRQQKQRSAAIVKLRDRFRERLSQERRMQRPGAEFTAPQYDEVFAEGMRWLDSLAGDTLDDQEIVIQFSDDIWQSRGRSDTEVS